MEMDEKNTKYEYSKNYTNYNYGIFDANSTTS